MMIKACHAYRLPSATWNPPPSRRPRLEDFTSELILKWFNIGYVTFYHNNFWGQVTGAKLKTPLEEQEFWNFYSEFLTGMML